MSMMFMPLFDNDLRQGGGGARGEVSFFCLRCGSALAIPAEAAGRSCECPRCLEVIPVPAMKKNERDRWVSKYHSDILAVEIEFLCPECRKKLVVEASEGAEADCAWCGKRIDVPQLNSLAGFVPATHVAEPSTVLRTRPALLTPEELEFLTGGEGSRRPAAANAAGP